MSLTVIYVKLKYIYNLQMYMHLSQTNHVVYFIYDALFENKTQRKKRFTLHYEEAA